jgi:hypothetical protein
MSLIKETLNDKVEVVQTGNGYPVIQVRTATVIKEDGVELSKTFHRKVITPTDDYSQEESLVVNLGDTLFTEEVKNSFTAYLASQNTLEVA